MSFMSFMSHNLNERVRTKGENVTGMLGTRYENPMKKPRMVDTKQSEAVLKDRICLALGADMSGQDRFIE
jgi:hypothetical protein